METGGELGLDTDILEALQRTLKPRASASQAGRRKPERQSVRGLRGEQEGTGDGTYKEMREEKGWERVCLEAMKEMVSQRCQSYRGPPT